MRSKRRSFFKRVSFFMHPDGRPSCFFWGPTRKRRARTIAPLDARRVNQPAPWANPSCVFTHGIPTPILMTAPLSLSMTFSAFVRSDFWPSISKVLFPSCARIPFSSGP